jgi:primase-polymerase (primpol)-like protein
LAFCFKDGDNLCGIDLDECRFTNGTEDTEALSIINRLNIYTEISPSAGGFKLFAYVNPNLVSQFNNHRRKYEAYNSKRYFAVTGWTYEGHSTINDASDAYEWFGEAYLGRKPALIKKSSVTQSWGQETALELGDSEMQFRLKVAMEDEKFRRLWEGNIDGYPSLSEAVPGFLWKCAFWFGDVRFEVVDQIFRQSSLWRGTWEDEKWERLGEIEWHNALAMVKERFVLPSTWEIELLTRHCQTCAS